jgi:hypothetical protein
VNGCPDVRSPLLKEVHYYDHHFDRGARWYRSNFPVQSDEDTWITGESSPYYLLHPGVPARVAGHLPDLRLIVLLRHPVRRAYSHFNHSRSLGGEPLSDFEAALAAESDRTDDAWTRLTRTGEREPAVEWFSYTRRSRYAPQLRRWLEYFPRESLLIMTAEELYRDPPDAVRRTRAHLGLAPIARSGNDRPGHDRPGQDYLPRNARSYPPMRAGVAERIAKSFAEDVQEVEALMGRPTGWELG